MKTEPGTGPPFVLGARKQTPDDEAGWQGRLHMGFKRKGERTVLSERRHRGPLLVQKPFYPEGANRCHAYIIHPPGGVVGGDGLEIAASAGDGSQVLITTPSAGKMYRSAGPMARQDIYIHAGPGGTLEWLPQETIVYDGARIETLLHVDLKKDARFIGWEVLCLGLPASGKPFRKGHVVQQIVIQHDEGPLLYETLRLRGGDPVLEEAWGLAGRPVTGMMAATLDDEGVLDRVRDGITERTTAFFAATLFNGLLVCRFLGNRVSEGLGCFRRVWEIVRPHVLGCAPCAPRIWNT